MLLSIVISVTMLTLLVWVIINAAHVMLLLTTRTSHTPTNIVTTQGSQVDTLHVQDDYQQISIHWLKIISQGIF